jgi:hypothetical protein
MAVKQASCNLDIRLLIGVQDYVATDYVALGYIEHTTTAQEVVEQAQVTVASTLSITPNATAKFQGTTTIASTVNVSVSALDTDQASVSISSSSGMTVGATRQHNTSVTIPITASMAAVDSYATPTLGLQTSDTGSITRITDGVWTGNGAISVNNLDSSSRNFFTVNGKDLEDNGLGPGDPFTIDFMFKIDQHRTTLDSSAPQNITARKITLFQWEVPGNPGDYGGSTGNPFGTIQIQIQLGTNGVATSVIDDINWAYHYQVNGGNSRPNNTHSSNFFGTTAKDENGIIKDLTVGSYGISDALKATGRRYYDWHHVCLQYRGNKNFSSSGDNSHYDDNPDGEEYKDYITCFINGIRLRQPGTDGRFIEIGNAFTDSWRSVPGQYNGAHTHATFKFGDLGPSDQNELRDHNLRFDNVRISKGVRFENDIATFGEAGNGYVPGYNDFRESFVPPNFIDPDDSSVSVYDDSSTRGLVSFGTNFDDSTLFLLTADQQLSPVPSGLIIAPADDITITSNVSADATTIIGGTINITPSVSVSVTAIEVPEKATSTISSTLSVSPTANVIAAGTATVASTLGVSVTAEETPEQATANLSSTLSVSATPTRIKSTSSTLASTATVSVTAVETPEQASVTISNTVSVSTSANRILDTGATISSTSSIAVTGTIGLSVVIQNIPVSGTLGLTVQGDRIRLATSTIAPQSSMSVTAEEVLEQATTTISSTLTVSPTNTRLRNTSVSITATPGLTANVIPNVFRILAANTLTIPKQTRTFAVPQQDKTMLIPKQTRLNTVNKQTRILPIPKQTRVLEIET